MAGQRNKTKAQQQPTPTTTPEETTPVVTEEVNTQSEVEKEVEEVSTEVPAEETQNESEQQPESGDADTQPTSPSEIQPSTDVEKEDESTVQSDQTEPEPEPTPAPEKADTEEATEAPIDKEKDAVAKPEVKAVTQPLVVKSVPSMKRVEAKADTVNINTISTEEYFQMKHGYVFGTGSDDLQEIIQFFDRYEIEMARGVVVPEQKGASLQQQLYRNYLRALMIAPKERSIAMDYLLWKFFKNEKSSYRVTYLGRFTRTSRWDIPELLMFNTMNSIFQAIANPSDRLHTLREFKLGAIVGKFPADKARYTEAFLGWAQTLR